MVDPPPQAGESTGGANNRAQRQRRQTILTEPRDQFRDVEEREDVAVYVQIAGNVRPRQP
ncbi:hypothetical protein ACETU7_06590 [Rhodococcus sp. 3Y1]